MAATGHEGEIDLDVPVNAGAPGHVGALTARVAHYPGCQQLTLWLPLDGYAGYTTLRIREAGGAVMETAEVTDRLSGRVQILIDTYPWPAGRYAVEINHRDGWGHDLRLEKREEGAARPAPPPPPAPAPDAPPIVYRDGTGKVLPNLDLDMRNAERARLTARFSRRLEFDGNFRAGIIWYIEGDIRLKFYHEMCGGGVHFSIDVPVPARWEAETGRPLAYRADIVEFLAAETQRKQARSWNYAIHENRIDFVD